MKNLLKYLTIALSLIVGFGINVKADQSSPQVIVFLTEDRDIREQNPFGWRMPAAPISCQIDFNALSITSDRLPTVLSYELWNDTGESMIISYSNDYDMVSCMASLAGVFQLRLISAETSYIGYMEL